MIVKLLILHIFILNKMHFNKNFVKFDEFNNNINIIKTKIINKMNSYFNLNINII